MRQLHVSTTQSTNRASKATKGHKKANTNTKQAHLEIGGFQHGESVYNIRTNYRNQKKIA